MRLHMNTCLTFDDVALIPIRSSIQTRLDIEIGTTICGEHITFPVIPSNMSFVTGKDMLLFMDSIGGIGIIHRFGDYADILCDTLAVKPNLRYGFSVGVKGREFHLLEVLIQRGKGPKFVIIDVANGYLDSVFETIKEIKRRFTGMPIIAGNVCTYDGAIDLLEAGVNGIKVGIGNGSSCTTRLRTGVGIPQFTALTECVRAVEYMSAWDKVTIISDGGVSTPGDIAKALAAGAHVVMSGSMFAATDEAAPKFIRVGEFPNEQLYKPYFGSASEAQKGEDNVEGNGRLLPYKGSCKRIVKNISSGLRSSMSYLNARNLDEFYINAEFVRVTHNGHRESQPYILGSK